MISSNIISSGSSGNATVINGEILIDCGVSFTRLIGCMKELRLILLTHEHGDHFNPGTLKKLTALRPTIRIACCDWMVPPLLEAGVNERCIDVLDPDCIYRYDLLLVSPFRLQHNVPNCGWKIWIFRSAMATEPERLLYATDTCSMEGVEARDYDLYLLECNHHEDEILERIRRKTAAGEYVYEVGAMQNHLSWEKAMAWLQENGPKSQFIPMHQHVDKR